MNAIHVYEANIIQQDQGLGFDPELLIDSVPPDSR
jgi:hypothetical protein